LNCYRKYGHNESDEPAYTQPLEYQIIRKKKPIREMYRDYLISQDIVEKHLAESLEKEFTESLQKAMQESKEALSTKRPPKKEKPTPETNAGIDTKVPSDTLQSIAEKISAIPPDFKIHPKL